MAYNEKSKENLKKGRKITKSNAKEMQVKSVISKKIQDVLIEQIENALAENDYIKAKELTSKLVSLASTGDLKAMELCFKVLKMFDSKLEVKGDKVEFKLDFGE